MKTNTNMNLDKGIYEDICTLAPSPLSVGDTGLSSVFISELVSKHIYTHGVLDLGQLVTYTALEWNVLEEILNSLKKEALLEIKGPASQTSGLRYSLTDKGIVFAKNALSKDGYVGIAPVTVEQYKNIVSSQNVHAEIISNDHISEAFSGVVIDQELLDQLGAAVNSRSAVFIYGPPGSGKSYICEKLSKVLSTYVLIPHAIYDAGTVIQVYDPANHQTVDYDKTSNGLQKIGFDQRYVLCHRPVIISGGELTSEQLEVQSDHNSNQHEAPLQLKANNGIYLIDDLGRQKMSPKELFNRWIVPLETHKDFLNVHNGKRIEVPFDVILVFSTNLNPMQLADDAFLRRIGHKIKFDYIEKHTYQEIWQQVCELNAIEFEQDCLDFVFNELYEKHGVPMLPCQPRDLIHMAINHQSYTSGSKSLTKDGLIKAWDNYFIDMSSIDYDKSAYAYNTSNKGGNVND